MKKLISAIMIMITMVICAMSPTGNYIVWECPHCGAKSVELEIGTWNTLGLKQWSDGFRIAPMAPTMDVVGRCWKCGKVFCKWTAKWTTVHRSKVATAERKFMLWIGDYSAVKEVLMTDKKIDPGRKWELRLRMLWVANHRRRKDVAGKTVHFLKVEEVPVAEVRENMVKLSTATNMPAYLRAEVLREMGEFAAAKKMLDEFAKAEPEKFKEFEKGCNEVLDQIRKKNANVFLMK